MFSTAAKIDDFLKGIDIKFGPRNLLSRFFLKATHAAADRGVYLEFSTFTELMDINRRNLDTWHPMTTSFDPELSAVNEDNAFVIVGRDVHGDVVATQVARFLDWTGTNFKTEAEALRFFYKHPERDKAPDESCDVTAPNATEITGRLLHSGGIWYRPDYRGLNLGEIIPRLGRAYGYTRWGVNEVFGVVTSGNVRKKFDRRLGYREFSDSVTLRNSPTDPGKDLVTVLCRLSQADLIDDSFGFLMGFDTQVDAVVNNRRAQ